MLATFRVLEVLALFVVLGLPLNYLLFDRINRPGPIRMLPARWLLAPVSGLIVFACYTVLFYAFKKPVAASIPFLPCLAAALWLPVILRWRRRHGRPATGQPSQSRPVGPRAMAGLLATAGLAVVLGFALWPFFENPERVFWHYAGSDGYMYMRIAEHVGSPGTGVVPFVDTYGGAAGFAAEEMRSFALRTFLDKPATMSTLAGLALQLGLTPHETFSPLVIACSALLYLVLLFAGHSWLRLPVWAAVVLAALGSLSPPVWFLQSHTFLGNTLALPLFVLPLALVRPFPDWRTSLYLGLALAAEITLFPDGFLALAGMLVLGFLYVMWQARRRPALLACGSLLTLGVAGAMVACFQGGLLATLFSQFRHVTGAPAFEGGIAHLVAQGSAALKPLANPEWIWPALNLGKLPPEPLQPAEKPYLVLLALSGVAFFCSCIRRDHRRRHLACYLAGFFALIAGGGLGIFSSAYNIFRALAVFAFLPLTAVCLLPQALFPARSPTHRRGRVFIALLLLPLLVHFLQRDWQHFSSAYRDHAVDAQYDRADLRDRTELAGLDPAKSMIFAADSASFTAFARVLMLFSNRPLAITPAFNKFGFFAHEAQRPGARDPFQADLVLRDLAYVDIFTRSPELPNRYSSRGFAVTANDLVLFPDSDTFPYLYAYPAEHINAHQLPVRRMLEGKTVLTFFSREPRTVTLVVQLDPSEAPDGLPYAFDSAPSRPAAAQAKGLFKLPDFTLAAGVHTLTLGPLDKKAGVAAIRVYAEPIADPAAPLRGRWRTFANLTRAEQHRFRNLSPRPVRFLCESDPVNEDGLLSVDPESQLVFQVPAGRRHLAAVLRVPRGAYENLPVTEATAGVQVEIAVLRRDGRRDLRLSRRIDPFSVPGDRGDVAIEADLELPAGAEIELSVGRGPAGRSRRDWCHLSKVSIE